MISLEQLYIWGPSAFTILIGTTVQFCPTHQQDKYVVHACTYQCFGWKKDSRTFVPLATGRSGKFAFRIRWTISPLVSSHTSLFTLDNAESLVHLKYSAMFSSFSIFTDKVAMKTKFPYQINI